MIYRICTASLFCWIFISCYTGRISSAAVHVTLDSIEIFETHEWFKKPTVYFQCKGENHTVLPDVKEANVTYKFKGQESWQPLTNFTSEKCKRCGFYEQDWIPPDDIFEEWELCPSDFSQSDGKYFHVKEKEFNATFLCEECVASHNITATAANNSTRVSHKNEKEMRKGAIIAIIVVVSMVFIIGFVVIYKYLMKQRRAQEQARFMKLFDDSDDIEEELEMSHII